MPAAKRTTRRASSSGVGATTARGHAADLGEWDSPPDRVANPTFAATATVNRSAECVCRRSGLLVAHPKPRSLCFNEAKEAPEVVRYLTSRKFLQVAFGKTNEAMAAVVPLGRRTSTPVAAPAISVSRAAAWLSKNAGLRPPNATRDESLVSRQTGTTASTAVLYMGLRRVAEFRRNPHEIGPLHDLAAALSPQLAALRVPEGTYDAPTNERVRGTSRTVKHKTSQPSWWLGGVVSTARTLRSRNETPQRISCDGQVVPLGPRSETRLVGDGGLVTHNERVFLRSVDQRGYGTDMLVKTEGDLGRDLIMNAFIDLINAEHPAVPAIPVFGVMPTGTRGGLVVLVPQSRTLHTVAGDVPKRSSCTHGAGHVEPELSAAEFTDLCRRSPRHVLQRTLWGECSSCDQWFSATRRMIQTIAGSGTLGWVAGLGDRHLANILISREYAVFNIDFGVLFDEGRRLAVPELVPCRMTPIIFDAAGDTPERLGSEFARTLQSVRNARDAVETLFHAMGDEEYHFVRRRIDDVNATTAFDVLAAATDVEKQRKLHSSWASWV